MLRVRVQFVDKMIVNFSGFVASASLRLAEPNT